MSHDPKSIPDGEGEIWLAIHEVYYRDKFVKDIDVTSNEVGYTEKPITVEGATIEEIRQTLMHMLEALNKPILEFK
jgi:hypothetical protein